ncbi:hypothetical protein O181_123015 [Austropuccinia psidii MF-1]|uniref:Uncharacterized protein n=1 Tax=Austropuccinia psidii MF-1 TaxID=1389203 RepID=A0A9Q3KQC4_9BASI|nr:hypothetical protein [Austropuccinia psidii MF-1]
MRPKGGKGGSSSAPKPQLGPPEPVLAPNSIRPQNGHKTLRTQFWPIATMDHLSANGLWSPPEATRSAQLKISPHLKGNSSTPPCTPYPRFQEWTQFHLSKSRSQNQIPISKEDFLTHQSGNPWWQSEDHSRIPTTWPHRSWVGNFIQDYSKGHSQRLYIISISCQGIKYFNTPWTTQLVHIGVNQSTCMYLAQFGKFIFYCGN